MDLLTMFILICIGITHPQTPVVWNLARTRKDAYVISDYLTSMFNLTCKEYTPNDFVHPLGHGLLLFKDIYNFPASFFHADNVFIHVACAAKPSLSVCSDSVAPHTTALYIYKEEIS
jgi:hypothetical protein